MSYPPSYHGYPGYPSAPPVPPSSNGYPSNSLGSGIGFESLMSPSQPANGYGQPAPPAAAPYPIAGSQMPSPGFRAPPPAPSPVETGQYSAAQGMPMPGPSPGMSMPRPMGFGGAANLAHAAVAFQAPVNRMPQVNPNPNTGFNTAPYRTNNSYPAGTPSVHPSSNAPPFTSRSSFHGPETKPAHPMNTAAPYTSRSSFHGFEAKPTYPAGNVSSLSPQSVPSNRGTVKPFPSFNAQVDAEALRKAIGGFGTNVKQIVNILCTRSNSQRLKIALEYKSQFGRDLITDLRYALAGSLENLILAMMQAPSEYDATELRKAMKGLGTNESVLIEILCSRTNAEIVAVKQAYRKKFDRDLEKDVHSETSGHFRKFLISLLQANRDEGTAVDYGKARADADALYRAGEKRWGTDEARFNAIFASRSYPQLRATFDEYAKICKYDIEKSVEREMSGDLKNAMTTLVQCVRNTPGYFATKLYKSMKGLGTDDATLIRIVVTRCEVDMAIIKQEFQKIYSKTLADFIKGDTSGNYRKSLLGLIGEGEK